MYTKINISGPGSCINGELAIIQKALEDAGFKVDVTNSHPEEYPGRKFKSVEDRILHVKNFNTTCKEEHRTILITMNHQPWGG